MARIIPARAGFTLLDMFSSPSETDHPRSRGVYGPVRVNIHSEIGSSPLARGLLLRRFVNDIRIRIIPARAGFTLIPLAIPGRRADHPRSRGVYNLGGNISPIDMGSSPLARGLPPVICTPLVWRWIIPARAGFTRRLPEWQRESWDHPRSRGVYRGIVSVVSSSAGSSPLARGLPGLKRAI